jgi:hypothetical protein
LSKQSRRCPFALSCLWCLDSFVYLLFRQSSSPFSFWPCLLTLEWKAAVAAAEELRLHFSSQR